MIETINEALPIVKEAIEQKTHEAIKSCQSIHEGKHYLIKTTSGTHYYMLYKRDFYHTFGKEFKIGNQWGESINLDYLNLALRLNINMFLFVYADGKIYEISPEAYARFSFNRTQRGGETTCSIDIKHLKRFNGGG